MKRFGILGGLGPMATAYLMERIIDMTDAATDQEHLDMVVLNRPSVPDRTAYILDHTKPSPVPMLVEGVQTLEALGVDAIGTPCVTAHCFHDALQSAVKVPIIHMVRETARHLKECGVEKAGVLATSGTVHTGLFQEALGEIGLGFGVPNETMQSYVMSLIYDCVKAGKPADMEKFAAVSESLRRDGAEVLILGCTELSVIKRDNPLGAGYLDALEVLARAAVTVSEKPLRPEYRTLITK